MDFHAVAEDGRLFVAAVCGWTLLPRYATVVIESPRGIRVGIRRVIGTRAWRFVHAPDPVGRRVIPHNLQIGMARPADAKVWAHLGPRLRGDRWGMIDETNILIAPRHRVGFEMPLWGGGSLAVHFWEDAGA